MSLMVGTMKSKRKSRRNYFKKKKERKKERKRVLQQSATEGGILFDITYMWHLKRNDTNELIYKTERNSQN